MLADLYLRKSSADGGKSVSQQDEETTDGVLSEGWKIGRRFTDDARSASRYATRGRPDFAALLEHIRAGGCQLLAVWEASRPSRRESTYFELLEACRDAGTLIYVHTHGRTYDVRRRADWKTLAREALDAADYSAAISEASSRGKRRIAMKGKPAGALLYGYLREYDPHTREYLRQVEHPTQAAVVRRMAAAMAAGKSSASIARELNAEGIPRPSGDGPWRGRDIVRYATQPAYVRKRVHRGEILPDVEGDWPAILDEETWRRCCAIAADPSRRSQQGTDLKWFLAGVPRCCYGCADPLRPHRANGARRYACHTCWRIAVRGEDLDHYIGDVVQARLALPDAKDLFLPRRNDAEVAKAEADVAQLEAELAEWRALAKARKVSPASFAEFETDLLPRLDAARARALALAGPAPLPELEGVDVAARWKSLEPGTRRAVVQLLMNLTVLPAPVRGAPFTPDRVRIEWR